MGNPKSVWSMVNDFGEPFQGLSRSKAFVIVKGDRHLFDWGSWSEGSFYFPMLGVSKCRTVKYELLIFAVDGQWVVLGPRKGDVFGRGIIKPVTTPHNLHDCPWLDYFIAGTHSIHVWLGLGQKKKILVFPGPLWRRVELKGSWMIFALRTSNSWGSSHSTL